jgi:SseB protein N-terminal domain
VSSAVAPDAAGADAGQEARPAGAGGAAVPECGSTRDTVPESGSAVPAGGAGGQLPHGGIAGVPDRFRDDDGSADPAAAAALAAFAAGAGGEHDALRALAAGRLLVPVVAELGPSAPAAGGAGGEKPSDMALPTLVGRDGRRAIPAFTSVPALARWQPSARPVPADAAAVWRAAADDSCAVIIDVAGPVPLAVEGARLAALARGEPAPAPHEDPDVQAVVEAAITAAVARLPAAAALAAGLPPGGALVGFVLRPGVEGGDLLIELAVTPMIDAQELAARVGTAVAEQLGPRLRRGIALALG